MSDKFERYHGAQSWFAKNTEIHTGVRKRSFEIICQKIIEVMNVERAGVWLYIPDRSGIYEEVTVVHDSLKTSGTTLLKEKYPSYFEAIESEKVIVSKDVDTDPALQEMCKEYLRQNKVRSLLDTPIFSDGKMIGIVCCESTKEQRTWDIHDINFAASAADFAGRILETEKLRAYENELKHRIGYLETDLKKRLDDLHEAKLSLDMALDSAQVAKWDWEIPTGRLVLNRTWFTRLGYEFDELPHRIESFKKLIHPDDIQKVFECIEDHISGRKLVYEARFRMLAKNGEEQYVIDRGIIVARDKDGKPLRMTGVNVNITPVVLLEQSLLLSQEQLSAMIQSLPTPVAMLDKDFKYLAFSALWKEHWSQFGEIAVNKSVEMGFREFNPSWLQLLKEALSGKTFSREEDLIELKEGITVWLRWVVQPWKQSTGEIGGIVVMAENITSKKEAEVHIAQTSKLSALGEMAGGIAHEINNPLSIIKGYIDLLKRHSSRKTLNLDTTVQYLEKMDQTVSRISKIVNGMRRFSRESSMDEKTIHSINKIVEETLDICLERINNNGVAVRFKSFKCEALILCRPVEISQVLLNLINNSFYAISSLAHPWIEIDCEELDDKYRLKIIDSGPGIPAQVRQKLFQPFFTTKDVGSGTGLGLSISRGIIEEHGGKLYYLEEAHNTTFVIELPKHVEVK